MEKSSLSEKAYEITKENIVYGKIRSGEIITVGDLATQFKMSKTPVREALNSLKSEGLLKLLPYKGYMVSHVDIKDLEDLFTLRVLLEGGAAELAALNADKEMIDKLRKLSNVDYSHNDQNSEVAFMKENLNFHVTVAEASGNIKLLKLVANTLDQMQRVLYFDLKSANPKGMKSEHQELVSVIEQRDSIGAKKVAIRHIEESRLRIFSSNSRILK